MRAAQRRDAWFFCATLKVSPCSVDGDSLAGLGQGFILM